MDDIFSKAYVDMISPAKGGVDEFIKKYDAKEQITRADIVDLLATAAIDEWLAVFNYYASEAHTKTNGKQDFDPEFIAHAKEELEHFEKINNRIRELSQVPLQIPMQSYFSANSSGLEWKQELNSSDSVEILRRRLEEERGAIKFYAMLIRALKKLEEETGEYDSTTETLVKSIKADEEEHEKDLRELLAQYDEEHTEVVA